MTTPTQKNPTTSFCDEVPCFQEDNSTSFRDLSLLSASWNVNGQRSTTNLDNWFYASRWGPNKTKSPDIIMAGIQEMVKLDALNYGKHMLDFSNKLRNFWFTKILSTINPEMAQNENSYFLLDEETLGGVHLFVFIKEKHRQYVKIVEKETFATGMLNIGNKGAVLIGIKFKSSTLCFVNCHLAADTNGEDKTIERNAHFSKILNHAENKLRILDYDHIFWCGDLNYRTHETIPKKTAIGWANEGKFNKLLSNDQLTIEREGHRVFQGFSEGRPSFGPTYKFVPDTPCKYDETRSASYTDRILWRSKEASTIKQLSYNRSECHISDHKPITSMFDLKIKDNTFKDVLSFESPRIVLEKTNLHFETVKYEQSTRKEISIYNEGTNRANFSFITAPAEGIICKRWLNIWPLSGTLSSGKKMSITFELCVDKFTAIALNKGHEALRDEITLQIENGDTYKIGISAHYVGSFFGKSIEQGTVQTNPITLCVPEILYEIINAMMKTKKLDEDGLFSDPGDSTEVARIIELLETGKSLPESSDFQIHSLCRVLIKYLSSLSPRVLPMSLIPSVKNELNEERPIAERAQELVINMQRGAPLELNVLNYTKNLLRKCLQHKESNGLSGPELARICCECLVGDAEASDSVTLKEERAGLYQLMLHFLEGDGFH